MPGAGLGSSVNTQAEGQNKNQIPRRIAAPFVPQGGRDDKLAARRFLAYDVHTPDSFLLISAAIAGCEG